MLIIKTKILRIKTDLFLFFQNKAFHTTYYITNYSLMAKHKWKTPFELTTKVKLDISQLKLYGCKAYPLILNIPRKLKLEPRVHIQFLMNYDSSNVFRV